MIKHVFGNNDEWAISTVDGCLIFHPQFNTDPEITSTHLWREAYMEIEKLGGFDAVVRYLKRG